MDEPIPNFLNKPDKVVFWTWSEVYWFLGILMFVWALCSFLIGLILGALAIKVLRILQRNPLGDLTKVGPYWFFPSKRYKTLPPADIREFIG